MSFNLFIKSWKNDFQWLKQAMISIQKSSTEHVELKVCIDDGDEQEFKLVLAQVSQEPKRTSMNVNFVETSRVWPEAMRIQSGYLRQQWIKMNAHMVMGDDRFWIWDSDLIAQRPFSHWDFLGFGDKPIYWFSQYNSMMGGSDDHAHHSRMAMLKEIYGLPDIPFEWMRCIPIPQIGGILRHASGTIYWKKAYDMLCSNDSRFSEFNVIGQFCHLYFPDAFDWRNTHNYQGKTFSGAMGDKNFIVSQGYSWGGCPENVAEVVRNL